MKMAAPTDMREIYDLARYCNNRFEDLVSKEDGRIIEEYQQKFWAWANALAVFAKPYLSLDARLANSKYKEIREIVLLLLRVLKKNLDFGMLPLELYSRLTGPRFEKGCCCKQQWT